MGIFLAPCLTRARTRAHIGPGRVAEGLVAEGEKVNASSSTNYEIDDEEVKTVLRAAEHGAEEDGAWILLEPQPAAVPPADVE